MAKQEPQPSVRDLDARLKKARTARFGVDWRKPRNIAPTSGLGLGMRISIELVSALVVSVGIGWLLDSWLGTRPWLMLLFFVIGVGAAGLNLYRVLAGLGDAVGFPKKSDRMRKSDD